MTERSVQTHLNWLAENGYVTWEHRRSNTRQASNLYQIQSEEFSLSQASQGEIHASQSENRDNSQGENISPNTKDLKREPSGRIKEVAPPAKPSKAQERLKTRPDLDDPAFLSHLTSLPENRGIAVHDLYDRLIAWCVKRSEQPSRLRLLKWLDGERSAVPIEISRPASTTNGNGNHPPEAVDSQPVRIPKPRRPAADVAPEQRAMWTAVCDFLRRRLNADVFKTWFGDGITFDGVDVEKNTLKVRAVAFTRDWIHLYYSELIYEALTATGLAEFTLAWEIEEDEYEELIAA